MTQLMESKFEITESIASEGFKSEMISPEQEHIRITELEPSLLDNSFQIELQESILSPEVMRDTLDYWSGINVMGG